MSAFYGIDLGTTQCLVAQFRRNPITDEDELTCLDNPKTGEIELPSVVSFLSETRYVTGLEAQNRLYKVPDSTVELVKVRLGNTKKIYVQSAFAIPDEQKRAQETASLTGIADSFRKIVVVRENITPWHDENGILYVGIEDFLLDDRAMDL